MTLSYFWTRFERREKPDLSLYASALGKEASGTIFMCFVWRGRGSNPRPPACVASHRCGMNIVVGYAPFSTRRGITWYSIIHLFRLFLLVRLYIHTRWQQPRCASQKKKLSGHYLQISLSLLICWTHTCRVSHSYSIWCHYIQVWNYSLWLLKIF